MNLFRWLLVGIGTLMMLSLFVYAHLSISDRRRQQKPQRPQNNPDDQFLHSNGEPTFSDHETLDNPFFNRSEPSLGMDHDTFDPVLQPDPEARREGERESISSDSYIIALYVAAQEGELFTGREILAAMREHDLRYGKMKIFHQVIEDDGRKVSLFGIANMVEPGVFDASSWDRLQTPGLALFLQIPCPIQSVDAFDNMIGVAEKLATTLNGRLLDDAREPLTMDWVDQVRLRLVTDSY